MAYPRPYGQTAQGASPWSSGAPPGLQQQQPMFSQPMGAFDISGGTWAGQQQATAQQWMTAPMQPVQFVPNPAFMQQTPQQMGPLQRPMQQRSLSASRANVGGQRRSNTNNFGGQQQQQQWQPRQQQNNQNLHTTRFQTRMNNQQQQRGQSQNNRNFNNNNNNNVGPKQSNNNNVNTKQQNQKPQQNAKQQQQQSQQATKKVTKVTKVKKVIALKAKQNGKVVDGNKAQATNADTAADDADAEQQAKPQSKTAERKQLKMVARKNAEALALSKLPVVRTNKDTGNDDQKADEPIDQAQLKCVPAVFGFVCKLCDVFLRDKNSRRDHIDSDDHMTKFRAFEEEQRLKAEVEAEAKAKAEAEAEAEAKAKAEAETETKVEMEAEVKAEVKAEVESVAEADTGIESVAEAKAEVETNAEVEAKVETDH